MDSCYLCVLGGALLPAQPNRHASAGFGTCSVCGVHACQIHGDKMGMTLFRCADCLATAGIIVAVTASPPAGSPGQAAPVDQGIHRVLSANPDAYSALAPAATAPAASIVAGANVDAMANVLSTLLLQLRVDGGLAEFATQAVSRWMRTPGSDRRRVLGLPEREEASPDQRRQDRRLGSHIIAVGAAVLASDAGQWQLREPTDLETDLQQLALVAVWALAITYAAHGAETLDGGPFVLTGGLRLPPIVFLLGAAYARRIVNW